MMNDNIVITSQNVKEYIKNRTIGYTQTTLDVLFPNETIKSKNYSSESSGWILNGDGSAEFHNIKFNYIKLIPQSAAPTAETGVMYVDTSGTLKIYNGSSWVSVGTQT